MKCANKNAIIIHAIAFFPEKPPFMLCGVNKILLLLYATCQGGTNADEANC